MRPAQTPEPPYWAVIFTSVRAGDDMRYGEMAELMERLAAAQPGYLGHDSAREGIGLTVSYWRSLDDIRAWRRHAEHLAAQARGRTDWYEAYEVRIARVERAYGFARGEEIRPEP